MIRAVFVRLLAAIAALPALGSALIVATVPPVSRFLPTPLVRALRPGAAVMFDLIARLPVDSLPGRLFHGSYAPLPAIFGSAALAAHAALLALPWLALSGALLVWSCRDAKRPRRAAPAAGA